MSMYEKSKFRFSETFNNSNGKTSGSGFTGVILGLIGGVGFICGTFGYFLGVEETMLYMGEVLKLIAAATILLGVRKVGSQLVKATNGEKPEPVSPPLFQPATGIDEKG